MECYESVSSILHLVLMYFAIIILMLRFLYVYICHSCIIFDNEICLFAKKNEIISRE